MKKQPLVTIVTVTFNAEKYLEATIKSVIAQDYPNIEYIIIDGGSTDGTIDIIQQYKKYIAYWSTKPDKGIYDAMNKGIEKSTGEWINFLNAGDCLVSKSTTQNMMKAIKPKTNIIYGGINYTHPDKKIYAPPSSLDIIKFKLPFYHQSLFLSTKLAKKYPFNLRYRFSSDSEQFYQIIAHEKYKIEVVNIPVTNYLVDGFWHQNQILGHVEMLDIVAKHSKKPEDIFQHASFLALQSLNPNYDDKRNYKFSLQFNHLIKKTNEIKKQYKKIIIYGNGHIGQYVSQLLGQKKQVIIDKNSDGVNSYSPSHIKNIEFDIILICVLGREKNIIQYLTNELNIEKKKIKTFVI